MPEHGKRHFARRGAHGRHGFNVGRFVRYWFHIDPQLSFPALHSEALEEVSEFVP